MDNKLTDSLTAIKSYQKWGIIGRTFGLKEHNKILYSIDKKEGEYGRMPPDVLDFTEVRIYLEYFERLCQIIEDFTSLCTALEGKPEEFLKRILRAKNPKDVLSSLNKEKWTSLLRYSDINTSSLGKSDKEFLVSIRRNNISVLNKFCHTLLLFCNDNWIIFNKYKHANTFIYSAKRIQYDNQDIFILPVIYDSGEPSKMKPLVLCREIYNVWKRLNETLRMIMNDLLDRIIKEIEGNGEPLLEKGIFFKLTESECQRLEKLINDYENTIKRPKIELLLKINIHTDKIEKTLEFYKKLSSNIVSD